MFFISLVTLVLLIVIIIIIVNSIISYGHYCMHIFAQNLAHARPAAWNTFLC